MSIIIHAGHEFFEQLCSDHKLELVHPYEVESFLNRPIDVETWMSQVKSHVVSVNTGLISGKKKVFIVEVQAFKTNTTPSRQISVVVSVNDMCFISMDITPHFELIL